jgi:hypothetical protein
VYGGALSLSAASSFKNSLFLSSVFTLCCSVFSVLGRPNIHTTHTSRFSQKSPHNKKKKEEEEETEEEVKEEEEETEEK